MSESPDETASPAPALATEDDRRQQAAEINRKRTDEEWLRNKQRWIHENFPEKRKPAAG